MPTIVAVYLQTLLNVIMLMATAPVNLDSTAVIAHQVNLVKLKKATIYQSLDSISIILTNYHNCNPHYYYILEKIESGTN